MVPFDLVALGHDGALRVADLYRVGIEGTKLGKRYVDDSGDLELLCTKAGDGSLATGGVLLKLKEAKKLPSSD